MPRSSHRVSGFTESVIREMTRLAQEHNAINLAQGFPDFDPPPELLAAAAEAVRSGDNQYSITWGARSLRDAIAAKVGRWWGMSVDPEVELTVTCGATEGMVAAILSVLDPGDEIILFEPYYENYVPAAALAGATPRFVPLEPPDFRLDPDRVRAAAGDRTRAIVINTPNNPTGRVFGPDELEPVFALCRERDWVCITDEIYEHITYDGRVHRSPATFPGMRERTIVVSGLSKTFAVTGWRLGYVIAPPALAGGVRKVHDFLTVAAPTPLQEAAVVGLGFPDAYFTGLAAFYQARRDRFCDLLDAAGFAHRRPEGAYYVLADVRHLGQPDDVRAAEWLVREIGIAGVPGSSFYAGGRRGRHLIRFTFCKSDATLDAVAERLSRLGRAGAQPPSQVAPPTSRRGGRSHGD